MSRRGFSAFVNARRMPKLRELVFEAFHYRYFIDAVATHEVDGEDWWDWLLSYIGDECDLEWLRICCPWEAHPAARSLDEAAVES